MKNKALGDGKMKRRLQTLEACTHTGIVLALLMSLIGFAPAKDSSSRADLRATQEQSENSATLQEGAKKLLSDAPTGTQVSFKLDPWITEGMYLGERWVSPPTYTTAQNGKIGTIESRVRGLDAQGKPSNVSARWTPSDPDMVTVTPVAGNIVKIIVQRDGQSTLEVVSEGFSERLSIKAAYRHQAIQVEIIRPVKLSGVSVPQDSRVGKP
jgi:hypothetical protein